MPPPPDVHRDASTEARQHHIVIQRSMNPAFHAFHAVTQSFVHPPQVWHQCLAGQRLDPIQHLIDDRRLINQCIGCQQLPVDALIPIRHRGW